MVTDIERARLEALDAGALLRWCDDTFGADAVLLSSFGAEDVVLIDLAARHAPRVRVATLDTGRLHEATYETIEAVRRRYGVEIEVFCPAAGAVEDLVRGKGPFSFRESVPEREACCAVRKLEPLRRALDGRRAWVTGLRREQASSRAALSALEPDDPPGLLKINPLAAWSEAHVWEYVRAHRLPYNRLHDDGFRSIGCAPCTRAVRPGEDARAGRWWWEDGAHKECGLHRRAAGGGRAE